MKTFLGISFLLALSCNQNQGSNKPQQLHEDQITESANVETDNSAEFGCTTCSIEILVNFERNFNTLSEELISLFFCTFDKACKFNVEYSQYSNDLIFKFLNTYPELLLSSLSQMPSDSSKLEYIIQTFEHPISDIYDVDRLIVSLEEINDYPNLKLRIIKSLKNVN